jgi:hypothetical protein
LPISKIVAIVCFAMIGQRFGRYVVLSLAEQPRRSAKSHGEHRWKTKCDCGEIRVVPGSLLRKGTAQSCGCLRVELARAKAVRHGHSNDLTYSSWRSMKKRCFDTNHSQYQHYGAVGISVCASWKDSFEAFLEDMGVRPSRLHTIDRILNDKGYEPGNCRWATKREQAFNRKDTILITVGDRTLCAAEWSRRTGVSHSSITRRIKQGWEPSRAVWEVATRRRPWSEARRASRR